jgi:hypothetical protein
VKNLSIFIFSLILIGTSIFLCWLFFDSLIKADPGISAAVIGAIGVMAAGIWSHYSTRRREINSRHFIEKKNAYMRLINLIFDLFKAIKNDTEITEKVLFERLFEFKQELMVWGDQAVIDALEIYELKSNELLNEKDPSASLLVVDDLLRAIRKDLGHNDSQLKRGSLVGMLLIAEDRKKIISSKNIKDT